MSTRVRGRLDWCYVVRQQRLFEPFIEEFADRLNLRDLDPEQPRAITFYRAHQHQLDWNRIRQYAAPANPTSARSRRGPRGRVSAPLHRFVE